MLNVGIIPAGAAVEGTTALCGSAPRRGTASLGDMGDGGMNARWYREDDHASISRGS